MTRRDRIGTIDGEASAGKLRAAASRARKHARALAGDPAARRLEQFAEELEAKAAEIEAQAGPPRPGRE